MKGILNRFRKRNIQTNLPHLILVIFVVAVSVCLITGLFISHLTLSSSIDKFYASSNLPNLWIETDKLTAEDEVFLSEYEYSKRYSFERHIVIGNNKYKARFIVSDGEVSRPYLVEGEKGKGCYVDYKFIDKFNIGINYSVVSFNYTLAGQTHRLDFKVLGSLALAEDLLVDDECVIFIDEEYFLEKLSVQFEEISIDDIKINYNQVLITSDIDDVERSKIKDYFENTSTSNLKFIKSQSEIASFIAVAKEIEMSEQMLFIFPLLFIVVSILVIVSAICELVSRERYNIGLLKSLGIKDSKILSNYCGYGVFVCFIGALIGILVSPLIVPNMTFETYDLLFSLPRDEVKMSIPVLLIILIFISALIIGYFSAFFVCFGLTRKTPKECMLEIKKIKKDKRKRRKKFGMIGSAFKSMQNNLPRTIMSIVGITGCLMLTLMGFGVSGIKPQTMNAQNIKTFDIFAKVFQLFSIIILLLTVVILIMQIFKEKSKEMAMLRIHGESYIKIWLALFVEMLIIALISFVLAGIICQPIFIVMLRLFGINKILFINFASYLKTFLIVTFCIIAIAFCAVLKVCKINIVDATKLSE